MKNATALIEAVKVVITSGIAWAVIMGWWPMSSEQQAATLTFAVAVLGVIGVLLTNSQTTALSNPKDADGVALVRPDQSWPLHSAQRKVS